MVGRSNICTLVPRFAPTSHENLMAAVAVSETRQQILMIKMAGDLRGLLSNAEELGKISKADLMT